MSVAAFGLGEPAIAQAVVPEITSPPPKRQAVARADSALVPEPR